MLSRFAVPAGLAAALVVTVATGTPRDLPDVALSSSVLFHVERGVAVLAGFVAVLVLVIRTWNGQLPTELSTQGLKYGDSVTKTAGALDQTAEYLRASRVELSGIVERIEALERRA